MKELKRTVRMSLSGKERVALFKAQNLPENYTVVKEDDKHFVFEFVVYDKIKYERLISLLIRQKYSVDDELAILRQRNSKQQEFSEYNTFVEKCKAEAKSFVEERSKAPVIKL